MSTEIKLRVKKLVAEAIIPQYATPGAACFDLHALLDNGQELEGVYPGLPKVFRTGLSFEIPEGHVMLIYSRSGHGFKNEVRLANCVGVIDSDYRGEVAVKLTSDKETFDGLSVRNGDRIAQAMVIPVDRVSFEEVTDLSETERGTGGFGSTGA